MEESEFPLSTFVLKIESGNIEDCLVEVAPDGWVRPRFAWATIKPDVTLIDFHPIGTAEMTPEQWGEVQSGLILEN